MCLGVPGEVVSVDKTSKPPLARVKIGGLVKETLLAIDEEVMPGDYVIVHAGVVISKVSKDEYEELIRLLKAVSGLGGEIEL
ncbi:HypC/HybG/HupF family hydrogenase formation chaperone [Thermosphaera aggregans]|jgi:hydrogenase expression/formation protein HypC|uniref:Hydrogenase assembly chaperone hypC/hupF n=1 Tax=Thermosphaera aggregans (strain DSM 11486 / M11TL) TaxID=633148 RepID=D5U195_THEAM|nr:HypC/HybG/HupF family hydrogenase formation chaperone [Thermosphaera aggregans]ADG90895.1 hydrogenase assembly chaperone hypC/hupF [Thermosphaera aggregans DSM 11486]